MTDLAVITKTDEIMESKLPPLFSLIERFLDSLDCSESSVKTYTRQLKPFLEWIGYSGKSMNLATWTCQDILDYKRYLQTSERVSEGQNLTENTIAGYITVVRKLWSWLEQEGLCANNIAKSIKIKRGNGYKKHTLSKGQIRDALNTFDLDTLEGIRNYSIFNLMVRTGCRDIEIVRAKVKNLRTIDGHTVLDIQAKGKESSDQFKVLTVDAERPIRAYLDARKKVNLYTDDDFLFVSVSRRNQGQGLTTRSISRIVKSALREIGLDDPKLTAHSLRHTAITLAVAGGASLHQAQAMAGHKDPRTTMTYFHNQKRIEEAAEKYIDF